MKNNNYFSACVMEQEAKDLWRELSKKLHPDKGGNKDDFCEMNDQYVKWKFDFNRKEGFSDEWNIKNIFLNVMSLLSEVGNVKDENYAMTLNSVMQLLKRIGYDMEFESLSKNRYKVSYKNFSHEFSVKSDELSYWVNAFCDFLSIYKMIKG